MSLLLRWCLPSGRNDKLGKTGNAKDDYGIRCRDYAGHSRRCDDRASLSYLTHQVQWKHRDVECQRLTSQPGRM